MDKLIFISLLTILLSACTTVSAPTKQDNSVVPTNSLTASPRQTNSSENPSNIILASGIFHKAQYEGSGKANIIQKDNKYYLNLTDFEVKSGPDLYVYLSNAEDATDDQTISNSKIINLGRLKSNTGDQQYQLPSSYDAQTQKSVVIWCKAFSKNFSTAPLQSR